MKASPFQGPEKSYKPLKIVDFRLKSPIGTGSLWAVPLSFFQEETANFPVRHHLARCPFGGLECEVGSRKTAFAVIFILATSGVSSDMMAGALVVEGQAHVVDNTTLEIWGQRIRLAGIAAPDPNSEAGGAGKRYLEGLVSHVTVRCETTGPSYQTETAGRCVAGRQDLAASLVEMGHARRLVQQSRDR